MFLCLHEKTKRYGELQDAGYCFFVEKKHYGKRTGLDFIFRKKKRCGDLWDGLFFCEK